MFDDHQQRTVGRRELAAILVAAVAAMAVAVTALLVPSGFEPSPGSNPAEDAARQEINQIYQEELAAAEAAAVAKEEARQAELNATEEALSSLSNSSASTADKLPPEAEAQLVLPPAAAAPVPTGTPARAPDPATRAGWVRTKDGQMVNMQAIIDSVRQQGTTPENRE